MESFLAFSLFFGAWLIGYLMGRSDEADKRNSDTTK